MLDGILSDLNRWHQHNFFPIVALNLSATSLSEHGFASEIMRRVEACGISPRSLVLELTESAVVSDMASAIGALGRLRLKGFGLSIDDYGTGFSSMQQLSRLPFTELKIDRSFVHHANEKWNLRVILESAINIGHRLGLSTVAEGIETEKELALLASMGCKYAQGFLLARPMPADDIMEWRRRESPRLQQLCRQGTVKLPDHS
jgi:EAL domain-containing protein (putative c-di-GMP-specific phosphodiesterase class I)